MLLVVTTLPGKIKTTGAASPAVGAPPDPFNQCLVSVPLYLLFEMGILMARLA